MKKAYCYIEDGEVVKELPFLPIHLRDKPPEKLRELGYLPLVRKDEVHKGTFIDEEGNLTDEIDVHYEIKDGNHYIILPKYVVGVFKKRKRTEEELNEYTESFKQGLLRELKNKRELVLKQPFSFEFSDGYSEVDLTDPIDVKRIQTQVTAASISLNLPDKAKGKIKSLSLRDKDKTVHQISSQEMVDFWLELARHEQYIDETYWQHEENIISLRSLEELLEYDLNSGW